MASQATYETLTSLDRAEFLSASTRKHQSVVTSELSGVYGTLPPRSEGEGPRPFDFDLIQESNADLVDEAALEVRATAHAYQQIKAKLSRLRKQRRTGSTGLRRRHGNLRKSIDGTYGPEALALVGLEPARTRRYTASREQTLDMVGRLRKPGLPKEIGDPARSGRPSTTRSPASRSTSSAATPATTRWPWST